MFYDKISLASHEVALAQPGLHYHRNRTVNLLIIFNPQQTQCSSSMQYQSIYLCIYFSHVPDLGRIWSDTMLLSGLCRVFYKVYDYLYRFFLECKFDLSQNDVVIII